MMWFDRSLWSDSQKFTTKKMIKITVMMRDGNIFYDWVSFSGGITNRNRQYRINDVMFLQRDRGMFSKLINE